MAFPLPEISAPERPKPGTISVVHWTKEHPQEGNYRPTPTQASTVTLTVSGRVSLAQIEALALVFGLKDAALTVESDPPGAQMSITRARSNA